MEPVALLDILAKVACASPSQCVLYCLFKQNVLLLHCCVHFSSFNNMPRTWKSKSSGNQQHIHPFPLLGCPPTLGSGLCQEWVHPEPSVAELRAGSFRFSSA